MFRLSPWFLVLAGLPLLVLPLHSEEDPKIALQAEAKAVMTRYSVTLQQALKEAMASGGPVVAIEACNQQAGPIAAELTQASGWTLRRTSLKLRNPAAAPDPFEQETLAAFAARASQGEAVAGLSRTEIITEADGQRMVRFAQAIPTGELCLTCHGTEIKPDISARLQALYPEDQAVGYKAGDLRGIFSLSRPL